MSVLLTESLVVGYEKKEVVADINLRVAKGEVLCLLGPNGSGKSTILRTLSGLLKPISGKVLLKGQDVYTLAEDKLAKLLAVVLTERSSPALMTVFDIVAIGRYSHTGFFGKLSPTDIEIVSEALELVNATHLGNRYFNQLSDGEKQKIFLARALVQQPEVIIMDEPTSFLDIRHKVEFVSILNKLSREKRITIIVSLHEIELAIKCSDTVILVKDGKILNYGSPEEVLTVETLKKLYDVKGAEYNRILGSFELPIKSSRSAFVMAGAGSGALLFRALAKKDIGVCTGIVHKNDIDYQVAIAVGGTIISENAYEEISDDTFAIALTSIMQYDWIIDAGYPVGKHNQANINLSLKALEQGKTIFSLRGEEETNRLYGSYQNKVVNCNSITTLIESGSGLTS